MGGLFGSEGLVRRVGWEEDDMLPSYCLSSASDIRLRRFRLIPLAWNIEWCLSDETRGGVVQAYQTVVQSTMGGSVAKLFGRRVDCLSLSRSSVHLACRMGMILYRNLCQSPVV